MHTTMKRLLMLLSFILAANLAFAQDEVKRFDLAKGEVLDLLFLEQQPDTKELYDKYISEVVPYGVEASYQPMTGWRIDGHSQGNLHP